MRRAVILIAVLALILAFTGCREITTDLHDIYTVILNPGSYGAVNGQRSVTLKTDIHGRLGNLPAAQSGKWVFTCPGVDEWGRSHQTGYAAGICETLFGCTLGSWAFEPDVNAPMFIGWQTGGGSWKTGTSVFEADTILFPKWQSEDFSLSEGSVAKQIADLKARPGTPLNFTINVNADERIGPQLLSFRSPITITLKGIDPLVSPWCCDRNKSNCVADDPLTPEDEHAASCTTCTGMWGYPCEGPKKRGYYTVLTLKETGAMFTVDKDVTLILENVQLYGFNINNQSTIVIDGGTVTMKNNVKIAFNRTDSTRHGGGVTVNKGGVFNMEGGEFYNNSVRNSRMGLNLDVGGGAVWVRGGTFNMTGGRMEWNSARGGGSTVRVSHGGTFNMGTAGSQDDSEPLMYDNWGWAGGAVFVSGIEDARASVSVFNMYSGTIELCWAQFWGGAMCVAPSGHVNIYGGTIVDNDAGDGGAIDNEGTVMIRGDAWIISNNSFWGGTGGIANWNNFEMWDGMLIYNQGGTGGGIRNFGDFTLMGGDIAGNIANGGVGGGLYNLGHFYMHGGNISHNVSNEDDAGGIFHGTASSPIGHFTMTGGMIWNNRDQTDSSVNGLPGQYGNIRLNTSELSFNLARPGYFHLDPAGDHGWTGGDRVWPEDGSRLAGWERVTGPVPVYEDCNPDENSGNYSNPIYPDPTRSRNIYWFIPPQITYTNPPKASSPTPEKSFMANGQYRGVYMPFVVGAPRVEIRTKYNPSNNPIITYDRKITAVRTAELDDNPGKWLAPDYYILSQAGVPRGGSYFPSRIRTVYTANNAAIAGYAWVAQKGHLQAMTLEWLDLVFQNLTFGLDLIDNWPSAPTYALTAGGYYFPDVFALIDDVLGMDGIDAWPYDVASLPPLGNIRPPSQNVQRAPRSSEMKSFEQELRQRLRGRNKADVDRILALMNRKVGKPEWAIPDIHVQIENRKSKYVDPRLEKIFEEKWEKQHGQEMEMPNGGGNNGGNGASPF